MMWLLIAFIAVPMIEIALFIQVGNAIGLLWTLLIVLLTAIAGTMLVKTQGLRTMGSIQQSFSQLEDPTEPLANGAMILFSGALLLTPGFFTDFVGFALLIPGVRRAVFLWARSKIKVKSFSMGQQPREPEPNDRVVDAEFEDVTPDKRPTHGPSGWTQH